MIKLLRKDLGIKILAVCIAILMWGLANNDKIRSPERENPISEQSFSIFLQVQNIERGLALASDLKAVEVRVRGKSNVIMNLREEDVRAFVDLSGLKQGTHLVPVQVRFPTNCELVSLNPKQVEVKLDQVVTQQVPVEVELVGEPKLGFNAHNPVFEPTEVLVTGASSLVGTVSKGIVNVSIDQLTSSVSGLLPVRLVDINGKTVEGLKVEPEIIDVFVPIMQSMPTKNVPVQLKQSGEPDHGYRIVNWVIEPSFIQVTGSVEYLKGLESISTKPISVAGATKDLVKDVDLDIPEGYNSVSSYKARVVIKIEPKVERKTISGIGIKTVNLVDRYNASLDKKDLSLTLEGKSTILEGLSSANIQAWVDLKEVALGEIVLPVTVELPEGVKIISQDPAEVKVTIKEK
jgi:YbbR domain-containing protein